MCGLAGIFRVDESVPSLGSDVLRAMFKENQYRGRDATGVAFLDDTRRMFIQKAAMPAEDFVKDPDVNLDKIAASPLILMHVRQATKGPKKDNENNHPIVGLDWVVTHNGMVSNDDDLWEHYGGERFAAVDSSAINLALHKEGLKGLGRLGGSVTFAAYSKHRPGHLYLGRLGHNDLFIFQPKPGVVAWSSDIDVMKVLGSGKLGKLPMVTVGQLPDCALLDISAEGIKSYSISRSPLLLPKPVRPITPVAHPMLPAHYQEQHEKRAKSTTTITSIPRGGGSAARFLGKLPQPQYSGVTIPSPDLDEFMKKINPNKRGIGQRSLRTLFGTWQFWLSEGVVTSTFKPNKDVARFQKAEFLDWWNLKPEQQDAAECIACLAAELEFIPVKGQSSCWACPWCGVTDGSHNWLQNDGICAFCSISSLNPHV